MIKLFQNKFFIICLCVAVVLCAVPTTFSLMGYGGLAKNIVGTLTAPFRWCASVVTNGFTGIGRYFQGIDALTKENEALRDELESLREELERGEILEAENERLREYLDIKAAHPSFVMCDAMVIGFSADSTSTAFTLNRGQIHGIAVNMPVISASGVVGYVTEVGINWCSVTTVIDPNSSVGAYLPRTGSTGIVSGDYSLSREGLCKLTYVEANADVQVGDRVYSSGIGSVYPADLYLGEVISVEVDEFSRALVATVRPAVDFSALQWVMILTGYESKSAPAA